MSWTLHVWSPDKSTLRASYTDTAPGGIVDGFEWSVRGDGSPTAMQFKARPSLVDIRPRDIVQLVINGASAFYGVIIVSHPNNNDEIATYTATGARELIEKTSLSNGSYPAGDVSATVRSLVSGYLHPALTYDAAAIPDSGTQAEPLTTLPDQMLGDVLESYADGLGWTWGVDADGVVFFRPRSGSIDVPYSESDIAWLPALSDDVVTRGVVVVVQTEYGPMFYAHEDPQHALYGTSEILRADPSIADRQQYASLVAVDGAVDWEVYNDSSNAWVAGATDLGYLTDGDKQTRAHVYGQYTGDVCQPALTTFGLTLGLASTSYLLGIELDAEALNGKGLSVGYRAYISDEYKISLPSRYSGFVPLNAAGATSVLVGARGNCSNIGAWDVAIYEAVPYVAGDLLQETARSLIHLPTVRPAEIRLPGYVQPQPTLTVTGAPGGDVSGDVAEVRYKHTRGEMLTIYRMARRGDGLRALEVLTDRRRYAAERNSLRVLRRPL